MKKLKKLKRIFINLFLLVIFILGINYAIVYMGQQTNVKQDDTNQFIVNIKQDEIESFDKTTVDEVNVYGETINIVVNEMGESFNINLVNTQTAEIDYVVNMQSEINVGINANDIVVGSYFLQLDDMSYLASDDDLNISFNTITRDGQNNLIAIDVFNNLLRISKYEATKSTDQVDILIDPGHGGEDGGTTSIDGNVNESDLNLEVAKLLSESLTNLGYNVQLTRTEDSQPGLTPDEINAYQEDGRVTQAYTSNAKLVVSLHHNAGGATGFEVYTSSYASTKLASYIANQLINVSDYSTKEIGYIDDGIYNDVYEEANDDGEMIIQDYMYMIRETGGIATKSVNSNNYHNNQSLVGAEGVLVEFGYLDDYDDLYHVTDLSVMKEEVKALSIAIDEYLNTPSTNITSLK